MRRKPRRNEHKKSKGDVSVTQNVIARWKIGEDVTEEIAMTDDSETPMVVEVTEVAVDTHHDHGQDLLHEENPAVTTKRAHHTDQNSVHDHVRLQDERSEDARTLHLQRDADAAPAHHRESDVVTVHLTRSIARRKLRRDAVVLQEIATRLLLLHRVKSETHHHLIEENIHAHELIMFSLLIGRHDRHPPPRTKDEELRVVQMLLSGHIS